jgi:hypothetical protein
VRDDLKYKCDLSWGICRSNSLNTDCRWQSLSSGKSFNIYYVSPWAATEWGGDLLVEVDDGQLDEEIFKFIDFYVTEKMEQIGMESGFDADSFTFIYH